MPERIEVQRAIAATPEEIFAIVSDPQGQVAIDSSGMLMSAEPGPVGKVGDTFTVHMDRDALNDYPELGLYDVVNEITVFEPGREIAWEVKGNFNRVTSTATGWSRSTRARWPPRTTTGRRSTRR
jgi:hypothetical protein